MWTNVKAIKNRILDIYKEETEKKYKLLKQYYEKGPKTTKLQKKQISHSINNTLNPESGQKSTNYCIPNICICKR